ncbi:PREDICTED: grpE protein homolog, mitochondrial [Fragaria vesca subsp. vesca]|uniref:grpE protein homolog, mitochondrial n=1 Tax=Fragaria vesca subsp. vesca TaxID=101020 RepID=UPI0002C36035|nr:PREDICTED: grpE protein homolog, mitochondrial [Fragaria vesca subsp. vesca]
MANSLFVPNNYLVIPPPRLSSKPIAPPQLLVGFSAAKSSPIVLHSSSSSSRSRASSFKSHLAAARGYVPPVNAKEDNVQTSGADQQHLPSLRTLLKVYKDAIFNGDEQTVAEIEAKIEIVENKQNELVQKVSSMSAEVTSGKEKLIRLQADFDNCRKRFEKERLNVRTDAQGEVIESLLPMVDNFERAKQQIKPETEKEKKIDTSYQGIYKQFVEIMRSLRVASVPTLGKPFDPSVHEAIAREESQEFPDGIVIQEIRRGFLLGGRLLRPALVKVSIGPGSKKSPVATEKSSGSPATTASVEN